MSLIEAIDAKIGEVRTESLDMSVGEIVALHRERELVIQPDFQRLFRWSFEQRSRLIESLLLELPIPSIFLIEKESGVLELIDGLQRISSLLHFVDAESVRAASEDGATVAAADLDANNGLQGSLRLVGCDLVSELNGATFEELPLTLRLRLKRTPIRAVIIKRQSSQFLRYEMFKRLNTGGSKLSDQDIRNVNARMLGAKGAQFYETLQSCASLPAFDTTMELLSSSARETRAHEELVLRYFATSFFRGEFKGNVGDWLDNYMEAILLDDLEFGSTAIDQFRDVFVVLADKLGPNAFVKYRGGQPMGGVAPAYFEAVSCGAQANLAKLKSMSPASVQQALAKVVESTEFRAVTGPGANSLPKLERRIELVARAFASA